jgi:hypothetical protein
MIYLGLGQLTFRTSSITAHRLTQMLYFFRNVFGFRDRFLRVSASRSISSACFVLRRRSAFSKSRLALRSSSAVKGSGQNATSLTVSSTSCEEYGPECCGGGSVVPAGAQSQKYTRYKLSIKQISVYVTPKSFEALLHTYRRTVLLQIRRKSG